jgi:hypothetical protein
MPYQELKTYKMEKLHLNKEIDDCKQDIDEVLEKSALLTNHSQSKISDREMKRSLANERLPSL